MKKILIVEDHAIVRMGMDFLINDLLQPVDVHQAINFNAAVSALQNNRFDLIVLDINIPGGENSRMVGKLRAIQPGVKILVFSGSEEEIYALHYIHAGANGFLSKNAPEEEYKDAIQAVLNNGKYVSARVQQQMVRNIIESKKVSANPLEDLSRRELEVMNLLAQGKWTKEIATILDLKETTISTYKSRIFEKLEVGNIIEMFKKLELYKTQDLDVT